MLEDYCLEAFKVMNLFLNVLGNWQILGLLIVGVLMIYRRFVRDYYEEMWSWAPWRKRWILAAVSVLAAIQIREILMFPFEWIMQSLPTYSLADQVFFYLGNIHIRSILFYGILIFWLWRKMGNLLPAVLSAWFWIGLIELSFIPQHLIWANGLFLGLNQYLPFVLLMMPWILERKRFLIPRKAWIWFSAGIFMQYAGLIFNPWAVVHLSEGGWGFIINPSALPHPHLFTYLFDLGQHLMKTLFTIAGAFIQLNTRRKFHRAFKGGNTIKIQILECDG